MENVIITVAGLIAIAIVYLTMRGNKSKGPAKAKGNTSATDLRITSVKLNHPKGSVLPANTPITVTMEYRYKKPQEPLHVWVKILDTTYDSIYEGSHDQMNPGTGSISRYVHLTQAGTVRELFIVAKNMEFVEVFKQAVAVDYTYEEAELDEEEKNDGQGSDITGVMMSVPSPAVLKAGTRIDVHIKYDINAEDGLDIWVIPETEVNMTYEGTTGRQFDVGVVQKHFTIIEPCKLSSVRLLMKNASSQTVYQRSLPVDFTFTA